MTTRTRDDRLDMATLEGFLGLAQTEWEMTPSERLVVVGLLELLRPRTALELGHRFGGCTRWLSQYCGAVLSCDTDPVVVESCARFPNVQPLHMRSDEAIARMTAEGRTFDLVFVDADHSFEGASRDLRGVLPLADIVLMHDTSNPTCRAGYLDALEGHPGYFDLDLVEGHVQVDGLWGGIGIVTTRIPASRPFLLTPQEDTFHLLERRWREKTQPAPVPLAGPAGPVPQPRRNPVRRLAGRLARLLGMRRAG